VGVDVIKAMLLEQSGLSEEQIVFVQAWEEQLPPVIARKEVGWFLGGIITTGCLAKEDSRGKGPQGRVAIGSCVAYPTRNLLVWLVKSRGMERLKSVGEFLPGRERRLSLEARVDLRPDSSSRGQDVHI